MKGGREGNDRGAGRIRWAVRYLLRFLIFIERINHEIMTFYLHFLPFRTVGQAFHRRSQEEEEKTCIEREAVLLVSLRVSRKL